LNGSDLPLAAAALTAPPLPAADLDAGPPPSLWPRAWRAALLAFVVSRFVVLLGGWIGAQQLLAGDPARTKGLLVEGALMWDATWYWRIVHDGYFAWTPETGSNLAFCPLYPALVRGLMAGFDLIGLHVGDPVYGNFVLAGLLISNLSFLAALAILWRLVRQEHPASVADRTLLLVAVFPTGLFWSAIYTESVFFLLVVAVFWLGRQERWALASLLAGLAAITRWAGLLLSVVLLLEYIFRQSVEADSWGARLRAAFRPSVLWLALVPVPLLLYMGWLHSTFGNGLIFLEAEQKGWEHESTFFPQVWLDSLGMVIQSWQTTTPATDPVLGWGGGQRLYIYQDLGFSLLFAVLAVWAWWRGLLGAPEFAWLVLGVIFPLSLGTTMAATRYLLPLWPAFLLLARGFERRPGLERGWLLGSGALLLVTTYFWASGHWIA
jgi:hypothetical protein